MIETLPKGALEGIANNIQHLIILPTEKCNFRCTYCYEDFKIGKMSNDTSRKLKAFITQRSAAIDLLKISWFGGEPLLQPDLVTDISHHAQTAMAQVEGVFEGYMSTNAYLLDTSMANKLTAAGVSNFQISLDGDKDDHNRTRVKQNGRGTFDQIWGNLLELQATDLPLSVVLRMHVSTVNAERFIDFLTRVENTFLTDQRFSVNVVGIEDLSPYNQVKAPNLAIDLATRDTILERIGYISPRSNQEDEHRNAPVCYAAKPNSLVVRANGNLAKCTVAMNDPRNDVGRIRDDGTLEIFDRRLERWFHGYKSGDLSGLLCPLLDLSDLVATP